MSMDHSTSQSLGTAGINKHHINPPTLGPKNPRTQKGNMISVKKSGPPILCIYLRGWTGYESCGSAGAGACYPMNGPALRNP